MANLPEKNVVLVDKITNVPTDSNLFINANGEFKQASVNDVVNSSTVVSTAVETAINTAVQDSIDSNFKQTSGSPILLTDSADGTLIDFKGKGRSTQNGTPTPDNPIAIKSVADGGYFDGELLQGYYNESGGFLSNTSYVCSKNLIPCNSGDNVKLVYGGNIGSITFNFYDKDMNVLSRPSSTGNVTEYEATAPTNAKYVHFMFREVNGTITPQTAKPITVTINGKYALIVKSKGCLYEGELAQGQYATDGTVTSFASRVSAKNLISCVEGDNINLTYVETVNRLVIAFFKDNVWLSQVIADNVTELSGTVPSGANSFGITILNDNLTPQTAKQIFISINGEGETVTYIPLNEPLRSSLDGSVTDEVSLTECKRKFGKFVLNGTENWYFTANTNMYMSLGGLLKPNGIVISDYYVVNKTKAENTILVNNANVIIYDKRFATVDKWKAWLAENNVTLIYELAEPITETIEPVDIVTYDNVTYLTASDNAEMEIEYPTTKVAGIASIGYSKGRKAEYETEQLKKQLLEIQATIVNTL